MTKISIIGGGAWGTAIGNLAAANSHDVVIWVKEDELIEQINVKRENISYLPGIKLSNNIRATNNFADLQDSEIIFLVAPAQHLRDVITQMADLGAISKNTPLVICSKGIEISSKKLLSTVVKEVLSDNPVAALSGPNFADEIASLKPAITTVASDDMQVAEKVASCLRSDNFKVYTHFDIVGVELAGALKNVVAIATGVATGLNLPISTISAILTKGIHEITLISTAMGGSRDTMLEACGIGDLTLTCMSEKSRNMSLGMEIAKGKNLQEILNSRNTVAEGVATSKAVFEIAKEYNLNCYIFTLIYKILYENLDPKEAKFI